MVTNAAIAATLLRHACPARCGARRRSKTRQLGPAPCEPPMLRRRRRPRQSCQARRITQARQASPDKPHRMKGKIAATRWPSVASSGRGYAPSAGRHRWPARQLDASCRLSCRQIYADSGRHRHVVRSLRTGRRRQIAVRVLILHEDEGLRRDQGACPDLPASRTDARLPAVSSRAANRLVGRVSPPLQGRPSVVHAQPAAPAAA